MGTDIFQVSPGLLALIQGADSSLLPFARKLILLDCQVAGTSHQNLQEIEPELKQGEKLLLIRETNNKYDSFAVAIYNSKNQKLGYLPREKNETISRLLDAGKILFATLETKAWAGSWLKINIQVFLVDQ